MNDRIMPHNTDAEQAVLGSVFLSKYALQQVLEEINSEEFYLDSHAKIFDAIKYLAEKGAPIDVTTVTAELDKRKVLSTVGGVEYLTEIGVKYLTVYAFSTENWNRPQDEVSTLMKLFLKYIKSERKNMMKNKIRFFLINR